MTRPPLRIPRAGRPLLLLATAAALLVPAGPARAAELAITALEVSPNPVATGADFTVSITVVNNGAATQWAGIRWEQPQEVGVYGHTCPPGFNRDDTGSVVCDQGFLDTGQSATMTVSASAEAPGTFTHAAQVYPVPDEDPGNNRATGTITAVGAPPGETEGGGTRGTPPGESGESESGSREAGDGDAPVITGLRLSATRIRVGRPATVSFELDRPAVAVLTAERSRAGRRVGGHCVAPTRRNRRRAACTRWVRVPGSIVRRAQSGANRLTFTGRLAGRRLAPGAYRLVLRAETSSGSSRETVRFRIVR
jgi:hypothetical protein